MKVLHLTTHLNRGGISQYILSAGAAFRDKGHKIYVGSSGGEMEEEFRDAGLLLKKLEIRTKSELNPKIYWALPDLIRWIRQEGIELVHAHTRVTQVMSSWVSLITKIPFVTTCHGFYKRRLGRMLWPAWGEQAVAISDPVGTHLRETFQVPREKIRVVYNGIDLHGFTHRFQSHDPDKVRDEYQIPKGSYVIGTIARLVPDKGHEFLIRAIKSLEPENQNMFLLIVGDGRHRKYLEDLVHSMGVDGKVRFTGNLSDVSKPLAAMDIFVLPATWREGFGLSIVEAMACQKPVIVTNIWALNTLILNRVNGILVEPRDVGDLSSAIRLLLKDDSLREGIGISGKRTAEFRFSLDRMVEELEKVYEKVLEG